MRVIVGPLQRNSWAHTNGTSVVGSAFSDGAALRGSEIADSVGGLAVDKRRLTAHLGALNGFYAIISVTNDHIWAAVDHVRSIPLFYAVRDGVLYIDDDVDWLMKTVGGKLSECASNEFLLTGYVTGNETLYEGIKQITAGQLLFLENDHAQAKSPIIDSHHNWSPNFGVDNSDSISENDYLDLLDESLTNSVRRLIDLADGRLIVLPLSGGYDSRIIATLLRRAGYDQLLSYTYGRPGSPEVKVSKFVAESLGIDWKFFEYSESSWRSWSNSGEQRLYMGYANRGTSLPIVQEVLAIKGLKESGVVPDGSIIVPGHTGDFLSGKQIIKELRRPRPRPWLDLEAAIIGRHYSLWPLQYLGVPKSRLQDRISAVSSWPISTSVTAYDLLDYADQWNLQERQAKFIINSVRAYEYFGFEWWLPLWDKEFMEFWPKVPLEFRLDQALFRKFVVTRFAAQTGLSGYEAGLYDSPSSMVSRMRATAKRNIPLPVWTGLKAARQYFVPGHKLTSHPFAWYGLIEDGLTRKELKAHSNINSLLGSQFIKDKREEG